MNAPPQRFILSGGPGAGKTTLLAALAAAGERCFPEVARAIIDEQRACGGTLLPWENLPAFAAECVVRMRGQLAEAETGAGPCFFDRGIPDVIGYLRRAGAAVPDGLEQLAAAYTPFVFLAPPWRGLGGPERDCDVAHAEAVAIHEALLSAYTRCGFVVCELPRANVAERVAFVRRQVAWLDGAADGGGQGGAHLLIRHTRLAVPPGFCFGRWDAPLAESFPADAAQVNARLPWRPTEVWTSPASRCRRLAESLGVATVRVDPRLQEMHFGVWEGRRWEDFHGPESEAWALDPWTRRPPGGETAEELWRRVGEVRAELAATGGGVRVAVVTHGGVVRAWRGHALGRGFAEWMRLPVDYGAVEVAL